MTEYIEREKAWRKVNRAKNIEEALSFIDSIPTADVVEVKRGKWIPVPSSDMSTGKAYKCSECDKMRYGCRLPPYCQECGAKMDGERKCDNGE